MISGFSDGIGVRCGKVKSQDVFKLFDISHWEKRMPFIEMRISVGGMGNRSEGGRVDYLEVSKRKKSQLSRLRRNGQGGRKQTRRVGSPRRHGRKILKEQRINNSTKFCSVILVK